MEPVRPAPAARRRRLLRAAAVVVVAASCLLRAVYAEQLAASGALWQHRWAATDMHFFDGWARAIADGDVWTAEARHPHHDWHAQSAAIYFLTHAEHEAALAAEAERRGDGSTAATLLWDEWYGGTQLHQEPAYPYALAFVYRFVSSDVRAALALQVLLGLASLGLLASITARLFGRPAALVALTLGAFYQTLVVYELVLLRATAIVFLALLLVRVTMWAWSRQTLGRGAVLGACCAVAVLTKATFALVPLGTAVALVRSTRRAGRPLTSVAPALAGGLIGALLVAGPVFVRNARVGAPITSLSSVGPVSMLVNNAAGDGPSALGSFRDPWLIARVMGETGGEGDAVTRAMLYTHRRPWDLAVFGLRRLALVGHAFEAPNNVSVAAFAQHAPVLRWAPVGWSFVLPWALVGLALVIARPARRRRAAALIGSLLAALVPLVAFSVLARYRLVFVALALPFAAHGLVATAARCRAARWRPAVATLVAVAVGALWVARPLPDGVASTRTSDVKGLHTAVWLPRVDEALRGGDVARAERILDGLVAGEPLGVARVGRGVEIHAPRDADLARHYAVLWQRLAEVRDVGGDAHAAVFARRRATTLDAAAQRFTERQG